MEWVREVGPGLVVCAPSSESDHGQPGGAEEQDPQKQCRKAPYPDSTLESTESCLLNVYQLRSALVEQVGLYQFV